MTDRIERRQSAGPIDLRGTTLRGYAAVFDARSQPLPLSDSGKETFVEVIRPGAFREALASGADVLARFEHAHVIGRTSNGTLRLKEDARGLSYEIDMPDTTLGADVVKMVRRRDVPYSSFAFRVRAGGDTWRREGDTLIRELRSVTLIDVAPVSSPAYLATDVAVRGCFPNLPAELLKPKSINRMRLELAERA
jgi:HK97 family phage prohead protease